MKSTIHILTTLLLIAVMTVPATAFQKCCCDRDGQTAPLRPCCARAKMLVAKQGLSESPAQSSEGRPSGDQSHRCPCVKHAGSFAVTPDRIVAPAQADGLLLDMPGSPDNLAEQISAVAPEIGDTGPPSRIVLKVWRL
ncbi:MAG: hypothetical protein NXI04_25585 [Planctomycetaceae bacterium]|nr:hypothetical protein [Planctomycetaceae bacterium]